MKERYIDIRNQPLEKEANSADIIASMKEKLKEAEYGAT